ncbi:MAG: hypothetical protein COU31_02555 [Candidatus Magasanikbacteria bacterium CG10_big_fil_rev_8_21_14_0_10_40_10]|uniref:Uncharacterized protein n=1 Tax=Candidatus Magasanikbacteria bacterium CG10_big_fil_rev_8_21_14_0_10_40_10 TaxID=1974648 RepID=A0A2M6W413_9BACT|nr:MAG: hypothetical protein COU31_02555 [Candidatus Magasanikbacteria bacterium CG10_big_fil_rev_8_21_14_0_10_40_10]
MNNLSAGSGSIKLKPYLKLDLNCFLKTTFDNHTITYSRGFVNQSWPNVNPKLKCHTLSNFKMSYLALFALPPF